MKEKYEKIKLFPHPVSAKHKPLSKEQRAYQFAPFAALTGYEDIIKKAGEYREKEIDPEDLYFE